MVREGHAWAYRRYLTDQSFLEDEAKAREEGIGLWSIAGPVAPWNWRRGDRNPVEVVQYLSIRRIFPVAANDIAEK